MLGLNNTNIANKLRLLVIFAYVPLLLHVGFISYQFYTTSFSENRTKLDISNERLGANLLSIMKAQHMIVKYIADDARLYDYVNINHSMIDSAFVSNQDKIDSILSSNKNYLQYADVNIYHNNQSIKSLTAFNNDLGDALKSDWFDKTSLYSSGLSWGFGHLNDKDSGQYLICYKVIYQKDYPYSLIMVVSVDFSEKRLYETIKNAESGVLMFLCNDDGKIVSSTERDMLGGAITDIKIKPHQPLFFIPDDGVISYCDTKYVYTDYILEDKKIGIEGWKLITLAPYDNVMKTLKAAIFPFLIVTIFVLSGAFFIIYIISNNITRRTEKLIVKIAHISEKDFDVGKGDTGEDELGKIDKALNKMADQLDMLIKTVYEYDLRMCDIQIQNQKISIEKKEAIIRSLQSQINPHYLYNTLESIRMNLVLGGDKRNAEIIQIFAESFQTYMRKQDEFVTIREELLFAEKYIKIQQYRFDDKISYSIFADEALYNYRIPRLILQPLLENALTHGLERKDGKGALILEMNESDEFIFIRITDDGVGMDEQELERVNKSIQSTNEGRDEYFRIGLFNVNNRIKLLYGAECGLSIHSKKGYGTEVEVKLNKRISTASID